MMKDRLLAATSFLLLFLLASCTSDTEPAQTQEQESHILIVGGHASHDFDRWFRDEDMKTLESAGYSTSYTDQPGDITSLLADADILAITNNQPLPDQQVRQAIFDFADSGKGLLLIHPGLWYNWEDWPEYNKELAGGGSRSHGPYGPFEVRITRPNHPIVQGLPASFTLEDELYRYEADSESVQLDTLAVGIEPDTGTAYPVIWVVKNSTRNIVGITLGHDGFTHQSAPYRTLLVNSADWLMHQE